MSQSTGRGQQLEKSGSNEGNICMRKRYTFNSFLYLVVGNVIKRHVVIRCKNGVIRCMNLKNKYLHHFF